MCSQYSLPHWGRIKECLLSACFFSPPHFPSPRREWKYDILKSVSKQRLDVVVIVVQSLNLVWLFATPWTAAPGFPVLHCLPEFAQTHVHWVGDAIQPSHPLLPHSPPTLNLSQHQGLFQWVSSSHQMAKVLEPQLQYFQWIFRVDFL